MYGGQRGPAGSSSAQVQFFLAEPSDSVHGEPASFLTLAKSLALVVWKKIKESSGWTDAALQSADVVGSSFLLQKPLIHWEGRQEISQDRGGEGRRRTEVRLPVVRIVLNGTMKPRCANSQAAAED